MSGWKMGLFLPVQGKKWRGIEVAKRDCTHGVWEEKRKGIEVLILGWWCSFLVVVIGKREKLQRVWNWGRYF